MPRSLVVLVVVVNALIGAFPARAEDPSALADAAFQAGRRLLAEGSTAAACEQFAESYEVLPRHGTLLNLAVCREQQGLMATAFLLFEQAHAEALSDKRGDRERLTREHIEALRPRLSWFVVEGADGSRLSSPDVRCDGAELRAARSGAYPVASGQHRIRVQAPGLELYDAVVEVSLGDSIVIRMREAQVMAGHADTSQPIRAAQPRQSREASQRRPLTIRVKPSSASAQTPTWKRNASLTLMGAGAVSLAVGAVFGVMAVVDGREVHKLCPDLQCRTDHSLRRGMELDARARRSAVLANITIPLGGVLAGTGLTLLYLPSRGQASAGSRTLQVAWASTW